MTAQPTYQEPVFIEPTTQCAVASQPGKRKILIIGNSITRHGVYPSLGWMTERGMAASVESQDFVHLVSSAFAEDAEVYCANVNLLLKCREMPQDVLKILGEKLPSPDIIILQTGEHEGPDQTSEEIRQTYLDKLLRPLLGLGKNPLRLALGPWYPTEGTAYPEWVQNINAIYRDLCQQHGFHFASVERYATNPACHGYGEVPPVQWHPNDRGMAGYAELILRMIHDAETSKADIPQETSLITSRLSWPLDTVIWDGTCISLRKEEEILANLRDMKDAGIRQVMLSGFTEVEPLAFPLLQGAEKIHALLAREGMTVCQHHGLCPMFAPGTDGDQAEIQQRLKKSLEVTAALGAPVLVLHAGRPGGHFSSTTELLEAFRAEVLRSSLQQVLDCCVENLRAVMPFAHAYGIAIALENVDCFEPLSSLELLPRLVSAVNDSSLGYCFDSGHAHACGADPVQWIQIMGDKLLATHLHDNHGPVAEMPRAALDFIPSAGIDEHLPPGLGTIDWQNIIRALRRIPFTGSINFEVPPWKYPGANGFQTAIRYWIQQEILA